MKNSQFSLGCPPGAHKMPLDFIVEPSSEPPRADVTLSFSNKDFSYPLFQGIPQPPRPLPNYLHSQATSCIARIEDPLWQKVCNDILSMMGPLCVLKVWKSKLGEIPFQNKEFDILCETEEVSEFIKQYDFVLITSLQRYFPSLKQLRIQVMSAA